MSDIDHEAFARVAQRFVDNADTLGPELQSGLLASRAYLDLKAKLAAHVPCQACGWDKPESPPSGEELPIIRGALDAQEQAERKAAAANKRTDDLQTERHGDTLYVDLMYPGMGGRPRDVKIGLTHTRAADSLLIAFDFDRDGWSIRMDRTEDKGGFMDVVERDVELAFLPAFHEVGDPTPEQRTAEAIADWWAADICPVPVLDDDPRDIRHRVQDRQLVAEITRRGDWRPAGTEGVSDGD